MESHRNILRSFKRQICNLKLLSICQRVAKYILLLKDCLREQSKSPRIRDSKLYTL